MKKNLFFIIMTFVCCTFMSCNNDDWSAGDPTMQNVYYVGFEDWGKFKNDVIFNIKQGETVAIPIQFWCEFVRSYDVETYYYTAGDLIRGTDYEIVDDNNGNVLSPNANGAFTLIWKQAKKGVQNVYVKALSNKIGLFTIQTFDPNSSIKLTNQDVSTTVNNKTSQYEVRLFTQNYKVTVSIE